MATSALTSIREVDDPSGSHHVQWTMGSGPIESAKWGYQELSPRKYPHILQINKYVYIYIAQIITYI